MEPPVSFLFILDEDQKGRLALERLGRNSVAPFDPKEKIIEYRVAGAPDEPLASLSRRGVSRRWPRAPR